MWQTGLSALTLIAVLWLVVVNTYALREIGTALRLLIGAIKHLEEQMTQDFQDMEGLVSAMNDATNAIAAKIQALIDKLAGAADGGLTADETAQVKAQLGTLKDQLTALGADPSNPVPEPPPTT